MLVIQGGGVLGACDELGKVGVQPKADYSSRWRFLGYRKFPGSSINSADALAELTSIFSTVDDLCNSLREADSFWERCFKCPNGGRCCLFTRDSDLSVTEPEWLTLKKFLNSNTNLRDFALERLDSDDYCLFHNCDSTVCQVFDVRPLICRLVPFLALEKGGEISVWNPDSVCSNMNTSTTKVQVGSNAIGSRGEEPFIVVNGHHRILVNEVVDLLRFCKKYRKKKLAAWMDELRPSTKPSRL